MYSYLLHTSQRVWKIFIRVTRTSAAPYKPYGPYPLDIFMLQASILQNIQQITDFTYVNDVNMTPANLMVAIRLLVKCDLTLENIESALNIATPGSKYQYYRAVFLDYEDIILDQKRSLEMMTAVTGVLTFRYKSRWKTPVIAYLRFRT
jgi:hypothetical protein